VLRNGRIFIFNGRDRVGLEFNEELERTEGIGDLQFQNGIHNVVSNTAIPNGLNGVCLFGASVLDGRNGYFVGELGRENDGNYHPKNGLLK
jgi:hypothetical protein